MAELTRESSRVLGVMLDLYRQTGLHPTRRDVATQATLPLSTLRWHLWSLAAAGVLEQVGGPELRHARLVPLERLDGVSTRLERALEPCGTTAAVSRHRRRGEELDEPCRAAAAQAAREYRAAHGRAS